MDDNTKNTIQNHIDTKEVCLFMKGTPDAPQCGFSMAVTNMLKLLEVNFQSVNVLEDQNIREGIKTFSDWPTIPQLYIQKLTLTLTTVAVGILASFDDGLLSNTEYTATCTVIAFS